MPPILLREVPRERHRRSGQHLAGPGSFAALTDLTDNKWTEMCAQSQAVSEACSVRYVARDSLRRHGESPVVQ